MRLQAQTTVPATMPMSPSARQALLVEAAAIERDPVQSARLAAIRRLLETGTVLADSRCAAIGRRVTIADEDGTSAGFALVLPGDGDPSQGWISIDSPLGFAVAGRRAGDRVTVVAPAGAWEARILAVGEPPYAGRDGR